MLIVGDIGGTKTRLALVSPEQGPRTFLAEQEYHSADFPGLQPIVEKFQAATGGKATGACFDVAGPVIDGHAHLTNLPWQLEEADTGPRPEPEARQSAERSARRRPCGAAPQAGRNRRDQRRHLELNGPIGVVAPGTGLGEAFLIWGEQGYIACASEGGHADFAPINKVQAALWAFLMDRFHHVGLRTRLRRLRTAERL